MEDNTEMVTIQIPKDEAMRMSSRIAEMNEMYGDPNRSDWFDADDIAHEVADYFDAELTAALEKTDDLRRVLALQDLERSEHTGPAWEVCYELTYDDGETRSSASGEWADNLDAWFTSHASAKNFAMNVVESFEAPGAHAALPADVVGVTVLVNEASFDHGIPSDMMDTCHAFDCQLSRDAQER